MSRILPLPFHVFDELNTLRARVSSVEFALDVVALLPDGAHVVTYHRNGPTRTLWTKGRETVRTVADACAIMRQRCAP